MGTKQNPGIYDCYTKALPDEPIFTFSARDVDAPDTIRFWAARREACGKDSEKVQEAYAVAAAMEKWRAENYGRWRLDKIAAEDPHLEGKIKEWVNNPTQTQKFG